MKKKINPIQKLVLSWFQTDRDFESGKKLFMKHGSSMSFKNVLNRGGNTKDNYKFLCYELALLAGISESRYKAILKTPMVKSETPVIDLTPGKIAIDYNTKSPDEIAKVIELVDPSKLDYQILRATVKALEIKPENYRDETLEACIVQAKKEKLSKLIPDNIKRSIKLREEFPFLNTKECPRELKILVSDMLTAYDNYIRDHEELVNATDAESIAALSQDVVEEYLENRSIWAELNHFKAKGVVLGEHPIFDLLKREAEIRAMANADLIKLRDSLNNNIPRTAKLIKDESDHKNTEKREAKLIEFKNELEIVKSLLDLND